MENKNKLINLRESISQRMDLSSEEQDRIFSQIAFDFLETKEIEEILETLWFMTTWGFQDTLFRLVLKLISQYEYWYATNLIEHITSTETRDDLFCQIIKSKLLHNDKEKVHYYLSLLSNKKLHDQVLWYIDNPDSLILEQYHETARNNNQLSDLKGIMDDIFRKAKRWELNEAIQLFDKSIPKEHQDAEEILKTIYLLAITNIGDLTRLEKIKLQIETSELRVSEKIKLLRVIQNKQNETMENMRMLEWKRVTNNAMMVLFSRTKKNDNTNLLSGADKEIYSFLLRQIELCDFVLVSKKKHRVPSLCYLWDDKFTYVKDWNQNNPQIHKKFEKTMNGLRNFLVIRYVNNFLKDAR